MNTCEEEQSSTVIGLRVPYCVGRVKFALRGLRQSCSVEWPLRGKQFGYANDGSGPFAAGPISRNRTFSPAVNQVARRHVEKSSSIRLRRLPLPFSSS
jgi:hypothetical protein